MKREGILMGKKELVQISWTRNTPRINNKRLSWTLPLGIEPNHYRDANKLATCYLAKV